MQVYKVGPSELNQFELDQIEDMKYRWFVYDYQSGCYEGSGIAVMQGINGKLYSMNLGHCSCYGPTDGEPREITLDDITKMRDSVHSEFEEKLIQKVLELMGQG